MDGTSSDKPARAKVIKLHEPPRPSERKVFENHLANLRASGLTDETIQLAGLYTEHRPPALAEIVGRKTWPRMCGNGLVFPFHVPGKEEPVGYRVRPTTPRTVGTRRDGKPKVAKYDQSFELGVLVYFTPRAIAGGWYAETARTLYWTEGEKKALAFDQLELSCVGLTGVWNWIDSAASAEQGDQLHPLIVEHVAVRGRHHVICFDSDARDNDKVMMAAGRLTGVLLAAGATSVRFVCPPTSQHKGIDDFYAAFGADITRSLLDSAERIEPVSGKEPLIRAKTIKSLRDAGLPDELRIPAGYVIESDASLWKEAADEKHSDAKVCVSAPWIVRHVIDSKSSERFVEIRFERDGRWLTVPASRKAIADARTMVSELAPRGAPVTSNNAAKLIDWFEALERVNGGVVAEVERVGCTGWHHDEVFVLDVPLTADEHKHNKTLVVDERGDRKKTFGALRPLGSLEEHRAALRSAWTADPVCAVMIAAALAAPLLKPLGVPNFGIHLPGDSSRGKTSMLKCAASVYGDPNNEQWVGSWNTSVVGAELRATTLSDLPLCFDEVGAALDIRARDQLIYTLINGGGRSRGQARNSEITLRETLSWRTILLSTGERELASESSATGAQIRVIHLPVSGFGKLDGKGVDELRDACARNSGSFGREWIEEMLNATSEQWDSFRALYRDNLLVLRECAPGPLAQRTAMYWAVLATAETLASGLGIGERGGLTVRRAFLTHTAGAQVRPLAERALDLVRDWITSEPEAFPELGFDSGGGEEAKKNGARVWCGFRRKNGQLLLIPDRFREFCSRHDLSYDAVLETWKGKYLRGDRGHNTRVVRVGSDSKRFIVLDIPVLEESPEVAA